MDFIEEAGWRCEGKHCRECDAEITFDDPIYVDVDAESDGDGGFYDRTTVECEACHACRTESAA